MIFCLCTSTRVTLEIQSNVPNDFVSMICFHVIIFKRRLNLETSFPAQISVIHHRRDIRQDERESYIVNITFWILPGQLVKKDNGPFETRSTQKRPNSSGGTSMINSIEVEFKIFQFGRASVLCSAQNTRSLKWNQNNFKPPQRYQWIRTDWCVRVFQYSSET